VKTNLVGKPQPIAEQPAMQPRPRQLPPIPRFDGLRPHVPSAASAAAPGATAEPAAVSSRAAAEAGGAPASRIALAPLPKPAAAVPAAATAAAGPRQQVVLGEASEACGGSDDETVPHVMSKLALKIAKGRQSLAPGKVHDGQVGAWVHVRIGRTPGLSCCSQEGW
jgi:hypothetical protein